MERAADEVLACRHGGQRKSRGARGGEAPPCHPFVLVFSSALARRGLFFCDTVNVCECECVEFTVATTVLASALHREFVQTQACREPANVEHCELAIKPLFGPIRISDL